MVMIGVYKPRPGGLSNFETVIIGELNQFYCFIGDTCMKKGSFIVIEQGTCVASTACKFFCVKHIA